MQQRHKEKDVVNDGVSAAVLLERQSKLLTWDATFLSVAPAATDNARTESRTCLIVAVWPLYATTNLITCMPPALRMILNDKWRFSASNIK